MTGYGYYCKYCEEYFIKQGKSYKVCSKCRDKIQKRKNKIMRPKKTYLQRMIIELEGKTL